MFYSKNAIFVFALWVGKQILWLTLWNYCKTCVSNGEELLCVLPNKILNMFPWLCV